MHSLWRLVENFRFYFEFIQLVLFPQFFCDVKTKPFNLGKHKIWGLFWLLFFGDYNFSWHETTKWRFLCLWSIDKKQDLSINHLWISFFSIIKVYSVFEGTSIKINHDCEAENYNKMTLYKNKSVIASWALGDGRFS